NVTNQTIWTSSDAAVVAVATAGFMRGTATALGAGSATITALYMGLQDKSTVTVTSGKLTGIMVTPVLASIRAGQTQQFTATAFFDDMTTANVTGQALWSSSDTAIADIVQAGGGRGAATGLKGGSVKISATYMGFSDTVVLTVTAATLMELQV